MSPRTPETTRPRVALCFGGRTLTLGDRTLVMGVVNCTPDSFFAGGRHTVARDAVARYHQVIAAGADWVDVGGESTRPGAQPVDADEEWQRIAPVLAAARSAGHPLPLSVDTTKVAVAQHALDEGALLINDVSGLALDARLADLAARYQAGLIVVHMRGSPRTMQANPAYTDLLGEIAGELMASIATATARGVAKEQIIIDPGIGFGKTASHNLEILRDLDRLEDLGRPLLIGASRKSFIGAVAGSPAAERLAGTLAAHTAAVIAGAHIVRVHDVAEHVQAMRVADAVRAGGLAAH